MQAQRIGELLDALASILDARQIDEIRKDAGLANAPPQELVRRGLVTKYQLSALVQGRGKSLVLGQFLLLEPLGEGGMGQVFKAKHRRLDRLVALKIIRKERVSNPSTVSRFHKEAKAAAKLSSPHVVGVYDADEVSGLHFMAMELVNGVDLKKLVSERGPLSVEVACDYIRQAAKGLSHAHQGGLVHRDIKPANLFLTKTEDGEIVKVLDFGLTLIEDEKDRKTRITQVGSVVGTVDYMSPEQAQSARTVDARTDIYSLGCTLFYLLTGKPPFDGGDMMARLMARILSDPPSLIQHRGDISADVDAVVRKMLARDPAQRYQTAAEVIDALEPFIKRKTEARKEPAKVAAVAQPAPSPESAMPEMPIGRAGRAARPAKGRGVLIVVGVAVFGLACIGLGALMFGGNSGKSDKDSVASNSDSKKTSSPSPLKTKFPDDPKTKLPEPKTKPPDEPKTKLPDEPKVKSPDEPKTKPPDEPKTKPPEEKPDAKSIVNSIGVKLVLIPAGEFTMGSPNDEPNRAASEGPQHRVRILKPFYMGIYEVKQSEFEQVMGRNPSEFKDSPDLPVGLVRWPEAVEFCKKLSDLPAERKAGRTYRLPTEAEWEYACRAGTTTAYWSGNTENDLGKTDWYATNSGGKPHKVGQNAANAWGLYDMQGNIHEWCMDGHRIYQVSEKPIEDPEGPNNSPRALKGGGFRSQARGGRCANRDPQAEGHGSPDIGFRVICVASNMPDDPTSTLPVGEIHRLKGHEGEVSKVRFSPDGKRLASCGHDKTVRIWDVDAGKELRSLLHRSSVLALAWTPTGQVLSGTSDGMIVLWDGESGKELARLTGHSSPIQFVAVSSDGRYALSCGHAGDPTVRFWDLKTGKLLRTCTGHTNNIFGVTFGGAVNSGFSASVDGTIRAWNPTNGKELGKMSLPSVVPFPVVWLPHEKHLLVGGSNGRLVVLDPSSGKTLREFVGHSGEIRGADASPDGKRVVSGSNDGTIRYWDAQSGKELHRFTGLGGGVVSHIEISPDGRTAASVHNLPDTLRLWGLPKD